MMDLWYKNAVIYALDVGVFMDSDGDGIGDFRGLTDKLDHIASLGATCLWLLPFYPSPRRDEGYDISDYYGIDPRFGSLGDFVDFTRAARERGMRVLVDLVANHTSDQHPWFQSARCDPRSKFRDWYIWSKEKPEGIHRGMVFPPEQKSTWTWDDAAQAWYFHRFFAFQPDLNIDNPAVREEIERVMGCWLQLGASGFRMDAVPFVIREVRAKGAEGGKECLDYLDDMRRYLMWRSAGAVLLGEANVTPDRLPDYFGDGDRMQMLFNFILNQHVFLALARGEAIPIAEALAAMPPPREPVAQWANFLRNHDELDLGRLSDRQRGEIFEAFAPESSQHLFGRGIRRRLAPMLGGDTRRLAMAHSLLFALPGTPVLFYGEEIGMGEVPSLPGRHALRTPMQWSDEPNGGFSTAPAETLMRPVPAEGPFGYRETNVAVQRGKTGSLLERMRRLIAARRGCPEIGWGTCEVLDSGGPAVLAMRHAWRGAEAVTVHNLADRETTVRLGPALGAQGACLVPLLASVEEEDIPRNASEPLRLEGYGYRWFRPRGERR